jgi:acyl carrier protein
MEIKDFIAQFAEQLDNVDAENIKADTVFKDLEDWTSLAAIFVISMIKEEYGASVNGDDIRKAHTIQDLFDIVQSRM